MKVLKSRFAVLAILLALGSNSVLAQEKAELLTLNDIQSIAVTENKDLIAARFAIREAEGRLKQAGLWPNPDLELARTTDRSFNNEGEYAASAGFSQKFPISGRLAKAKEVSRVDIARAVSELRNQERLLIGEVTGAARALLIVEKKLSTNEHSQKILKDLINGSEKRLKQAEVSPTDVNLEKIELQKLTLRASTFIIEREKLKIALSQLLGRAPTNPVLLNDSVKFDSIPSYLQRPVAEVLERRPDLQLAALGVDRAAAELKLAKAQRWEDWTIGLGYERDVSVLDIPDRFVNTDGFIGARISIPLPLWNRNEGKIAEVNASRSRAQAEVQALELKITSEVDSTRTQTERLLPVVRQYERESLKLAEDNARILSRSYVEGLTPISAVIQAQQQLVEIREAYTETLGEFAKAITELETATASNPLLERSSQ